MKLLNKLLASFVFATITFIAVLPFGASFDDPSTGVLVGIGVAILTCVLIFFAPTSRRAWGRGSLLAGVLWLALPISMSFLGAKAFGHVVTDAGNSAAANIGAGIGVGAMVGAAWFLGVVLGAIFLILGLVLVLGGRREVVVLERDSNDM